MLDCLSDAGGSIPSTAFNFLRKSWTKWVFFRGDGEMASQRGSKPVFLGSNPGYPFFLFPVRRLMARPAIVARETVVRFHSNG